MKYTIELTENQANQLNDIMIGINASWGYASAPKLKKAIPIKQSPAYKKGFEDGNKIADKDLKEIQDSTYNMAYNEALKDADHAMDVLKDMTVAEGEEWFGNCVGIDDVICKFTIQRIIDTTKAYEEKKKAEEIKVGDVVKFNEKCHNYDHVKSREFLVLHVFDNGLVTLLYDNGDTGAADRSLLDKTSRHIDEVEQLLDKLRSEEK